MASLCNMQNIIINILGFFLIMSHLRAPSPQCRLSCNPSHHIISLRIFLQRPCAPSADNGLLFSRHKPFMSALCKSAFLPGWFLQGRRRAARLLARQRAFVPVRFHVKCNKAWGTKAEESDPRCVSARQAQKQEKRVLWKIYPPAAPQRCASWERANDPTT